MEIITFVFLVTAAFLLALIALASRVIGIWPLQKPGPDPARHESEERRATYLALITCAGLVAYSLGLCLLIEKQNQRCGTFLPTPYHPRGWRRAQHVSEDFYRMVHNIETDRPLTATEVGELQAERARAEDMNTLHDYVESSVMVHIFVPLAFVWLGALLLRRRSPLLVRVTTVPLLGSLIACMYLMATRQYFVALMGD